MKISLQSLFFNAKNFTKKETLAQVFSSEFREHFENTIFIEHLRWMLLELGYSILVDPMPLRIINT